MGVGPGAAHQSGLATAAAWPAPGQLSHGAAISGLGPRWERQQVRVPQHLECGQGPPGLDGQPVPQLFQAPSPCLHPWVLLHMPAPSVGPSQSNGNLHAHTHTHTCPNTHACRPGPLPSAQVPYLGLTWTVLASGGGFPLLKIFPEHVPCTRHWAGSFSAAKQKPHPSTADCPPWRRQEMRQVSSAVRGTKLGSTESAAGARGSPEMGL